MASLGNACRLTYRAASSQLCQNGARRGFRNGSARLAAHNFTMPAMSPTMTEGSITSWKVKEGDSYSAGDVLLEIETDKAQMDVEAQDDGVVAKIMQGDGSKAVAVGTRIAVLADPGDDVSSLEIPAEDSPKQSEQKSESKEASASEETPKHTTPKKADTDGQSASAGKVQKQTYPLYPSVSQLLLQNGLSKEDADKIPSSGPGGRLLKGDVLAYLGHITKSYSAEQSSRISKLGHLDLSNIKVAPPAPAAAKAEDSRGASRSMAEEATPEVPVELSLPISLSEVLAVQRRIEKSLGTHLPLSTFVARAVDLANEALPLSANYKPTADDLFNAVLGLDKHHPHTRSSYGDFVPSISTSSTGTARPARSTNRRPDVFDEILGSSKKAKKQVLPSRDLAQAAEDTSRNVFSVEAQKGDEKRAMVFLQRMKTILEAEPGRLVL